MKRSRWDALLSRYPALFALILFVFSLIVNLILQPNMFAKETLNSNMRVFLPIILMSVGQAIVILGGGIDISVGSIVSIVNTVQSMVFSLPTCVCSPSSPRMPPVFCMLGSRSSFCRILAAASRHKSLRCIERQRRLDCHWLFISSQLFFCYGYT
jgi:ribose/xylose/arabinose/galactoside ABC-type transport system permease subunit